MARLYFGTDGIRGRVNRAPMTAETSLRLAIAAARHLSPDGGSEVVIGRDTRLSGEMIEAALVAGFSSMGMTPVLLGVVPTPAVALLTRETGAALGVMVSASHNPSEDNGLKLFSPEGTKFDDATEEHLEQAMAGAFGEPYAAPDRISRPRRLPAAGDTYVARCLANLGQGRDLSGLRIVLDCAHGAGSVTAPAALKALGAQVTLIGASPDGLNINAGVGSTAPGALQAEVTRTGADIGIALDGDADRLIVVDETGRVADGDQVMALIAADMHRAGTLKGGGMVATVMSNIGLADYLQAQGLSLARTQVGDRYVGAHMRAHGFNLGGEQSGHIILSDVSTTGDGLMAALKVLSVLAAGQGPASEILRVFSPAPQKLVNIAFTGENPMADPAVGQALSEAHTWLGRSGRIVVRKSGTEPLIRIMAEAHDEGLMLRALNHVADAVRSAAAG